MMEKLYIEVSDRLENEIHIVVKGFINDDNYETFNKCVLSMHKINSNLKIVINFDDVEMITYKVVDVLKSFKNSNIDFKLINTSKEVNTILYLLDMIDICEDKKMYSISTEGCKVLGKGFHSEVYRLDDERIAKVYYEAPSIDMAIRERMIAKQAFIKGVPTEISFQLCEAENRPGLLYELIDAKTLLSTLSDNPDDIDKYIKEYVELVKSMHKYDGAGISGIYNKKEAFAFESSVVLKYLPEDCKSKLENIKNIIPDSNMLVHGDPHPANIMLTKRGMIFIDLSDMGIGDEKFDLMYLYRTLILFNQLPDSTYALDLKNSEKLWNSFIEEYYKGKDKEYIEKELKIIRILALNSICCRFLLKDPNMDKTQLMLNKLIEELRNNK